uniref:Uncharacterized protein n=1 Tax=Clandestinovirus TaxID=2831644 RepID=A0A8F8KND2_9VIRU|nr:hypothetical protein KOM_12_56 [Clandestinovirus]
MRNWRFETLDKRWDQDVRPEQKSYQSQNSNLKSRSYYFAALQALVLPPAAMTTTFRAAVEKETDLICLYHVANDFGKQLSFALRHRVHNNLKFDVTWPSTSTRHSFEYATSADAMEDHMFLTNRGYSVMNMLLPLQHKVFPSASQQASIPQQTPVAPHIPQLNQRFPATKQQTNSNLNQNQFRIAAPLLNSMVAKPNPIASMNNRMVIPSVAPNSVVCKVPTQFKGVTTVPTVSLPALPTPNIINKMPTISPLVESEIQKILKLHSATVNAMVQSPETPNVIIHTDKPSDKRPEAVLSKSEEDDAIIDEEIEGIENTIKKVSPTTIGGSDPKVVEDNKPGSVASEPSPQPNTTTVEVRDKESTQPSSESIQATITSTDLKHPKPEPVNFTDLHILSESAQVVKESTLRKRKRDPQGDSDEDSSTPTKRRKLDPECMSIQQWRNKFSDILAFDKREFVFDKKMVDKAPLTKKLLEQKWGFKFGKTVFQIQMVCQDGVYQMKLLPMVASHVCGEYLWSEYTGNTKLNTFKDLHKTPSVIHMELISLLKTKPTTRVAPESLFLVDVTTAPSTVSQKGYWQFPRGFSYERLKDLCMVETNPKYKHLHTVMEKLFFKQQDDSKSSHSEDCSDQIK